MSKTVFGKIAAGLNDAIAFAEGDETRAQIVEPVDIKRLRAVTRKTQVEFAHSYGLPLGTVRDWEQRRTQPDAPARVLLRLIAAEPETVERLLARAAG